MFRISGAFEPRAVRERLSPLPHPSPGGTAAEVLGPSTLNPPHLPEVCTGPGLPNETEFTCNYFLPFVCDRIGFGDFVLLLFPLV